MTTSSRVCYTHTMPYKDPESRRRNNQEWRLKRKAAWINGRGCSQCGSFESLEADHIDPETKLYNPKYLWAMALDNPIRVSELEKCQVLCKACHRIKTNEENSKTLTPELVRSIRIDHENGMSQLELSNKYNIHKSSIYRVVHRITWSHIT